MKKLFLIFNFLLLLTGCATSSPLMNTPQAKSIRTVSINENVDMPKDMDVIAPNSMGAVQFGIIGDVVAADLNKKADDRLKNIIDRNHISIQKIVRDEFIQEFKKQNRYKLVDKNADAVIQLSIKNYGLEAEFGAFDKKLQPELFLKAHMYLHNQVVWYSRNGVVPNSANIKGYSIKQMEDNPALLASLWQQAAEDINHKLISDLLQASS